MPTFTMKLHFIDGHVETFEFEPPPKPVGVEAEDVRLQIARAMKEGVLRLHVDDSELMIFTAALAYIEHTPAMGGPATFPHQFRRVT